MKSIQNAVAKLKSCTSEEQIVNTLQEINQILIAEYELEICKDLVLQLIEVESYYSSKYRFEDPAVHCNILQQNHFGKLYLHRKTTDVTGKILRHRGGLDFCLSDDDSYFGVLIRRAVINQEDQIIQGPSLLLNRVLEHGEIVGCQIDEDKVVLKPRKSKTYYNDLIFFHSDRIGLSGKFEKKPLRTHIDLKGSKQKEKDIEQYLTANPNVAPNEFMKKNLGYVSKSILEKLKS